MTDFKFASFSIDDYDNKILSIVVKLLIDRLILTTHSPSKSEFDNITNASSMTSLAWSSSPRASFDGSKLTKLKEVINKKDEKQRYWDFCYNFSVWFLECLLSFMLASFDDIGCLKIALLNSESKQTALTITNSLADFCISCLMSGTFIASIKQLKMAVTFSCCMF